MPSPLLSIQASKQEARDLLVWDEVDQARLASEVQGLAIDWHQRWGLEAMGPAPEIEVSSHCQALSDLDTDGEAPLWRCLFPNLQEAGPWCCLQSPGSRAAGSSLHPFAVLGMGLFEDGEAPSTGRMADDMVQAAWQDWCEALRAHLYIAAPAPLAAMPNPRLSEPEPLPKGWFRPWSGSLVVSLPWCGQTLRLALGPKCAATALGHPPRAVSPAHPLGKLCPLLQALDRRPLTLRVDLLPLDIDLGTLSALQVGDVLRTRHPLNAPLRVGGFPRRDGEMVLCGGYLGSSEGHRAIELAPILSTP